MKIIYYDHAEEGILDRKIGKKIIEDALLNPDDIVESRKGRRIAHKIIGNKLLRVIYEKDEKAYIVITAYYAEPKRYMRK